MKLVHNLLHVVMVIYAISGSYSSVEELEESGLLLKSEEESIDVTRRVPPLLVAAGVQLAANEVKKAHDKNKQKKEQKKLQQEGGNNIQGGGNNIQGGENNIQGGENNMQGGSPPTSPEGNNAHTR